MAHTVLTTWPGEEGIVPVLVPAGSKDCMDRSFQRSSVGAVFLTPKCSSCRRRRKTDPACPKGCLFDLCCLPKSLIGCFISTLDVGLVLPRIQCWDSLNGLETEAAREGRVFLCILTCSLTWQLGIAWTLISVCYLIDRKERYN